MAGQYSIGIVLATLPAVLNDIAQHTFLFRNPDRKTYGTRILSLIIVRFLRA